MRIEVSPADVAASRFAISPLGETMTALCLLAGVQTAGPLLPWVHRHRDRYAALRRTQPGIAAIRALYHRNGYNADFVQPPPDGVGLTFADQLAVVRRTPNDRARDEIPRTPTVFGALSLHLDPPWPYAIGYRARGVAGLFGLPSADRAADGLDRLTGSGRAAVLRALAVPATTSQLAAQLGVAVGTVGGQLAVLREAGLVRRTRTGREVRYERTALGAALSADP
ncbi:MULTISPECIES: ArsR/SmtB family transcription factor [unclassified Micromonospora]|uniref:ArsR/SmtB family transcription factor n=1 Tax=unclassified Micromonospora TaxID=2617518 RepID=UPI003A8AF835